MIVSFFKNILIFTYTMVDIANGRSYLNVCEVILV